jgi:hypothetical protein
VPDRERRLGSAVLTAVVLLLGAGPARAADWGGITPGETTLDAVRGHYGEPSKAEKKKIESQDVTIWTYEGSRAPAGIVRMMVEFGVRRSGRYQPNVVRTFRLEPKRGVFERRHVVLAWGKPDRGGTQDGVPVLIYKSGLTVYFDKDLINAVSLWFTVPQP